MNQQNCPNCDDVTTWLLFNKLYEAKEAFSRPESDRAVVLFEIHKCKRPENAPD